MSDPARELDQLLSEEPSVAARRASAKTIGPDTKILLFGAGTTGMYVLERLRCAGRDAAAFLDDTPSKQGTTIRGVPVLSPADASAKFGSDAVFVVTMLNPMLPFRAARARLQSITSAPVISFNELAWAFPAHFLPYIQFEMPGDVLAKKDDIVEAFRLFADDESRRQFAAHMRFRLHLDHDALPVNSKADYFPKDVVPPLRPDCVFVDSGAFDGDSIRRFLAEQHGQFDQVFAFEPDAANCERLRDYVHTLPEAMAQRIHVHCAANGDRRGTLRFNMTGNASAALSDAGSVEVDVVRIDEIVPLDRAQVYVKYDVEGGEWEALRGTERLLAASPPLLAVSIYHRPDDLWQLPLYLHRLNLGYRLYLRTQGEDGMDVICYAIP
ncbi:MAG TPA: FkbM family methyltransferase [Thermoanaerobaculia bacterium]|nr:FkbM family methyltransferase [Thermoanaerobaculia bacterium]